jgi:hypothetical protein
MENDKKKEERFLKIAENRTNTILQTLRLLGNCSNTNNYKYTDQQVKQIFSAIENELKITKMKFEKKENKFILRGK